MSKPNILVLGGEEASEAILAAGYPVTSVNDIQSPSAAIVIEAKNGKVEKSYEIMQALKLALGARAGLFFAWTEEEPTAETFKSISELGFDGAFNSNTPIPFITARLDSAIRIFNMSEEVNCRIKTLQNFGGAFVPPPSKNIRPPRILLYGPPSPESLVITKLLDGIGAQTIGAMSSYTAFDYLHNGRFDAIIVVAMDDKSGAISFCSALRRNSRLFHLPCLLVASPDFDDLDVAISRGATDAVFAGLNDELAISRLMNLIDEKRRRDELNLAFASARSPSAIDNNTGIYNQKFLMLHLEDVISRMDKMSRDLTLAIIKVDMVETNVVKKTPELEKKIISQAAAMLSRLVRIEDTAAILDDGHFAVIFPSTNKESAMPAIERIIGVLESTGFDIGTFTTPASVEITYDLISHVKGENSKELLGRSAKLQAITN